MYVRMYVCMYNLCICTYVRNTYVYACMYIYLFIISIHTHTHICISKKQKELIEDKETDSLSVSLSLSLSLSASISGCTQVAMKKISKLHELVRLLQILHRWRKPSKLHMKALTSAFSLGSQAANSSNRSTPVRAHGGCNRNTSLISSKASSCSSSSSSCSSNTNGEHDGYDVNRHQKEEEEEEEKEEGFVDGALKECGHHLNCKDCCMDGMLRAPIRPGPRPPQGFMAVYVGTERRRFVIRADHLNHPLFRRLLEKTEEEFGFEQKGGLWIACEVVLFEHLLWMMENKHLDYLRHADRSRSSSSSSSSLIDHDAELCELLDCYHMSN